MSTSTPNPFLRKPDNPNYLHRSRHHDYNRPARYLITISKSDSIGIFGKIVGNPYALDKFDSDFPCIELSRIGQCFETALSNWQNLYPDINIPVYQIMPDHIHICMEVRSYLKTGLSRAIARLMGRTTAIIRSLDSGTHEVSAFTRGFNDRIAYTPEQWERQKRYVADNPRRYLIKKLYPDLFYRRWIIDIDNESYIAQGNILLLKNPDIQVVRFSRKYPEGVFKRKVQQWEECTRTGGVLVSPFIHPNEKAVRKDTLKTGGAIIRVCENGLADRFCPQGDEFEYNGGSQLLLIAPLEHNSQKEIITYAKAQSLNRIAEKIATINWQGQPGRIRKYR